MVAESVMETPPPSADTTECVAAEPVAAVADAPPVNGVELCTRSDSEGGGSHYDRSSITRARVGDVVARVAPEIGAAALGEGVRFADDGVSLIATAEGRVVLDEAGRVHIAKSLLIEGNVDFATGHVEFPHDVTVNGNVADLFRVHSGGRLEVRGVIEAADVRAGAGLTAAGGISGKSKGRIAVEGDLGAKYVANAIVAATGNVTAATVVNSRVVCGGALAVTEGPILAGHVTATGGIRCEIAGSSAGIKTVIEAGVDEGFRAEAPAKFREVEALRRKAAKIRETVEPLMKNQKKLNAQQKERATELLFEADELESQASGILAALRKSHDAVAARTKFEIVVNETLYAGVTIRFPGVYAVIDDALRGPLRVTTRAMHNETRIVLHYGGGRGAAHPLLTHADPCPHTDALRKLLAPSTPAPAVAGSGERPHRS